MVSQVKSAELKQAVSKLVDVWSAGIVIKVRVLQGMKNLIEISTNHPRFSIKTKVHVQVEKLYPEIRPFITQVWGIDSCVNQRSTSWEKDFTSNLLTRLSDDPNLYWVFPDYDDATIFIRQMIGEEVPASTKSIHQLSKREFLYMCFQ